MSQVAAAVRKTGVCSSRFVLKCAANLSKKMQALSQKRLGAKSVGFIHELQEPQVGVFGIDYVF